MLFEAGEARVHPYAAYWLIGAAPVAAVGLLSVWAPFRRGYWRGVSQWGPLLLAAGALLAVDGVMSAAAGFWEFTDARFAAGRFLNLPAAEWLFFLAAMFGVRLLWYGSHEVLPRLVTAAAGPLRRPRLAAVVWIVVTVAGVAFALVHHERTRTMYVFALAVPVTLLLAMASRSFWTRPTQAYLGLGFALFWPMDTLMNGLGSFDHARVHRSGVDLPYGVPIEDLGYILVVLVLLRFLPLAHPPRCEPRPGGTGIDRTTPVVPASRVPPQRVGSEL